MRIIKESKKEETRTCLECNTVIGFEKEDIEVGELGCLYVTCPMCKEKIWLDEKEGLKLTHENIEYPRHFHFPKNAVPIDDTEIQKQVKNIAENVPEGSFTTYSTGDTLIVGLDFEDEIEIYVCKNPASTIIDKKSKGEF